MKKTEKKCFVCRSIFYIIGIVTLAMGLTLNTKCDLGVSPIISIAYTLSVITGMAIGNVTLIEYGIFVLVEIIIHVLRKKKIEADGGKLGTVLLSDVLQIALSLFFTRFLNIFADLVPSFAVNYAGTFWGNVPGRMIVLLLALILTAVGAALMLDMRVVPNPGDGIVQAISDVIGKSIGLTKNIVDICCILITLCISYLMLHKVIGIGIGSIMAMILVGRLMALFNWLFMKKLQRAAGVKN